MRMIDEWMQSMRRWILMDPDENLTNGDSSLQISKFIAEWNF
jgi:hypothetical protein